MAGRARIDLVHKAICLGVLGLGHTQWKDSAYRLVRDDPVLGALGLTPEGIRRLLREFVTKGNRLEERNEIRQEYLDEWPDDPYWYRAVIPFPGLSRGLFVEVKLFDDDEEEPWVLLVSAHEQK